MIPADLTHQIIGGAMEVHSLLGPGFLESIYRRALIHELRLRQLPIRTELSITIAYKGEAVGKHRLDMVVADSVVLELKAVSGIADAHLAQAISYLTVSRLELALILNFGEPRLTWKRVVKSHGPQMTQITQI